MDQVLVVLGIVIIACALCMFLWSRRGHKNSVRRLFVRHFISTSFERADYDPPSSSKKNGDKRRPH